MPYIHVSGLIDELVLTITKDMLLHLDFEVIITCVRLTQNLKILTLSWV